MVSNRLREGLDETRLIGTAYRQDEKCRHDYLQLSTTASPSSPGEHPAVNLFFWRVLDRPTSTPRNRRKDTHGLAALEDPLRALIAASGLLNTVDEHHLRERIGNFEPLDQIGEARGVVEFDLASPPILVRKAISEVREQAHVDSHRSIYGVLPASNVS
jgi:hypothetical protein